MSSLLVLLFLLSCFSFKLMTSQNKNSVIGDTIDAKKWVSIGSTVVSSGGNFELGFFTPGNNNSNYYIGIWYKKISVKTVIWVANRVTPVSIYEMDFAEFKISDGNLVLINGTRHEIWSTSINLSTTSNKSQVVATLYDNGDLIVKDENNVSLWSAFDHPSHTTMPGSKFGFNKRTNTKQVLTSWKSPNDPSPGIFTHEVGTGGEFYGQGVNIWNHSVVYWNSGPWTGDNFTGVPYQPNPMFKFTYVDNDDEVYYMFSFFNPELISRYILDYDGQAKQFLWMESTNDWNVFYTDPKQVCGVFGYCGSFATCSLNSDSNCDCLPGFEPKSGEEWDLKSFSGGCKRKKRLNCGNSSVIDSEKDKFSMHQHMRLPANNQSVRVENEDECESKCLENCGCVAYAYSGKFGCFIWSGELLNLEKLSQNDVNGSTIYIRLAASEFSSNKDSNQNQTSKRLKVAIPISVIAALVILSTVSYICYRKRRSAKNKENEKCVMQKTEEEGNELIDIEDEKGNIEVPFFSFESIIAATDEFSEQNKLGQGGFGPVYKGIFPGGREMAMKRLSSLSGQGISEFKNEVMLIARLQHRNLVRLLGYCIRSNEKILLYEYMANKSLDTFIFG